MVAQALSHWRRSWRRSARAAKVSVEPLGSGRLSPGTFRLSPGVFSKGMRPLLFARFAFAAADAILKGWRYTKSLLAGNSDPCPIVFDAGGRAHQRLPFLNSSAR